jgi:DUF4097 and DUF4098 domain-containing protein YvlB
MLVTTLAGALLLAALPQQIQTDTVFAADPRGRVRVETHAGDVVVRTWDRSEIRVQAQHSSREQIRVRTAGSTVSVGSENAGRFGSRTVDFELTVPATMGIAISGTYAEATIEGTRGEVSVENVQGDIRVRGGAGTIALRSVQGSIELEGARGNVDIHSASGDVQLRDIQGEVRAESLNGEVSLLKIDAASVQATTVSGDIEYDGTIKDDGRYSFTTHNGDLSISMPDRASASITVATFNGDFETYVPVQLQDTRGGSENRPRGRRFTFTLGSGSAEVELESFNGDITLRRPGFSDIRR